MAESTSTSTTSTPSTSPTANEELGVVSARAANAEQARLAAAVPIQPDDATLRLQALQVAQAAGGTPSEVMDRAEKYTTYLKDGRSDG